MGTPEFAVPSLEKLINSGHEVCAVFTKPDKPVGRKKIITPPPVKTFALSHNLKVYQPERIKSAETEELIKSLNPDLIAVVAYGKIISKNTIETPKYGCINVHGSLLPKYRGAAPIQWSIINGDTVTGITTMFMDEGLDTGDILLQRKAFINENETSDELKSRLSVIGAELLIETIQKLEEGTLERKPQDNAQATLSPPLDKINGQIYWGKSAREIHNLIRGANSWPIAYTTIMGKRFKIYKSRISNLRSNYPGKVVSVDPFVIGCGGNTSLELLEVQIEGKKRMSAADFARGYRMSDKIIFGLIK